MSDKNSSFPPQVADLSGDNSYSIYYGNLGQSPGSVEPKKPLSYKDLLAAPSTANKTSENYQIRQLGSGVAQHKGVRRQRGSDTVDMISNAGVIDSLDDGEIPNDYEFEIIRLRRRVDELECIVRDRDSRIVSAIAMLNDELTMYHTLLHAHVAETHGDITRRVLRIKSTLDTLTSKESKFYPPVEVPERWRKSEK